MADKLSKFLLFQALGEIMVWALAVPIPGSVITILLLAFYLLGREAEVGRLQHSRTSFLGTSQCFFSSVAIEFF
jgi:putative effector of murein hydrolase LrgA (UPF0299 family)